MMIRNEHRFAFRSGQLSEIPAEVLAELRRLYPAEEDSKPGHYDQHGNLTPEGAAAEEAGA